MSDSSAPSSAAGSPEPPEPRLPLVLAFLDKSNVTATVLSACACVYTRSAGVIFFCGGTVACTLSVKVLKRAIRQPRPVHVGRRRRVKKSYGMPSTHSASISYLALAMSLACFYLPLHPSLPLLARHVAWLIIIPWATMIAGSRVWLGHHTWPQVAVGCGYGSCFALIWYRLWTSGLNTYGNAIEKLLDSWIGWR